MTPEILRYAGDDPYGHDKPVYVLDDIRIKPGCQAAIHKLLTEEYLPLARERDMELAGLWLFPPFERLDKATDIVCLWRFDSLKTWWKVRAMEENDARLPQFWKRVEQFIVGRSRRLGRPPPLMTGMEPDRSDLGPFAAPASGRRHIAIVTPRAALTGDEQKIWESAAAALTDVKGVEFSEAGFHVDFSYHPGEMTWEIVATPDLSVTEELLLSQLPGAAAVRELVTLDAPVGTGMRRPMGRVREKRVILLRAGDGLPDAERDLLESTLLELARRVEGIRAFSLARLVRVKGSVAWTHCFEQEFTDHRVVTQDYLDHPFHWAVADRLFGPEGPEKIVYEFVHTIRAIERSMFAAIAAEGS